MEPHVNKLVEAGNVYYTLYWSRLTKADRFRIITEVPSVAGVFELYFEDRYKKLNIFFLSKAWYGGLRNWIRKATDPTLEENPTRRRILDTCDCYYRYTIVPSYRDMSDILFFLADSHLPHRHRVLPSGRYENIFLNEVSEDKIITTD